MNSNQIVSAVQRLMGRSQIKFLGVVPADHQPCVKEIAEKIPCCYIANTDPCTEAGTHWVAFNYPTHDTLEFFDSYGLPPDKYGFSVPSTFHIHKNNSKFQSINSDVCGYYVILFLYLRSKRYSLARILYKLRRIRPTLRDKLIKSLVSSLLLVSRSH